MGYYCVYIQMRERALMDLDEREVSTLFERAGQPGHRKTPLSVLDSYESPAMSDRLPPPMSLEKMWVALHHLLTGEFHAGSSPLSRAIFGGRAIGADLGDGRARYLWADEVREISTALSALTREDLRRRYAPASLKAGWPQTPVVEAEDDEAVFTELVGYFNRLATYYRLAAARGNAMLIGVV